VRILEALKDRRASLADRDREARAMRSNRRVLMGIALAATVMMFLAFGAKKQWST